MKYFTLILAQLFVISTIVGQSYTDKKGNEHLWGKTSIGQLSTAPYDEWYTQGYEDYESNLSVKDGSALKDATVKIFIGTWCGDTKKLLPKFIKTWQQLGLSVSQLEIIAVHNEDELYKQGPADETADLNMHRVPTFIFEREGEEFGRIVERTVHDLDTDLMMIAKGQPYKPRYAAVSLFHSLLDTMLVDSLLTRPRLVTAYNTVYREVSTASELNTYGYVLMAEKKMIESEFVLKVNRYLFPYHPNARDSYGEILMKNGKHEAAKEEYLEAIRIKPDSETAIKKLAELNELLKDSKKETE